MNGREEHIKQTYEREGWRVLRGGAPDFFMRKGKRVIAVEVKSPGDRLSPGQAEMRDLLVSLGIEYRLEVVERPCLWSEELEKDAEEAGGWSPALIPVGRPHHEKVHDGETFRFARLVVLKGPEGLNGSYHVHDPEWAEEERALDAVLRDA